MANNENLIPIPGRLHSVATEGHVSGADEIYDDTLQKDQATINAEVQTAIGTGGSVDSRIAAAIDALDATATQSAGADGLALSVTETNGKVTAVSGSIAANTYDAYGAASTAKFELIGDAASDYNTLGKLEDKIQENAGDIDDIEGLIPSQATSSNQLADKGFVNSSISTSTATFRGTSATGLTEQQFLTWANSLTKDANDYVFWNTVDSAGNTQFKRYKYDGTQWSYEYTLNNSSFTAAQWASIESGITSELTTKLSGLPTGTEITTAISNEATARADADTAINAAIGTDSTSGTIKGRIKELEDAADNGAYIGEDDSSTVIASFDPQADTVWKKEQILSSAEKEQIQQNIGIKEWLNTLTGEKFVSVTATDQTSDVTDLLPATGATDTIYRVGMWDGTSYDEEYYSDYAWDGTDYIQLNKKSIVGEVFDISEYKGGTKYSDLSAALGTNGENVPSSVRKGGMSIKFVSNSDNKYLQFRLISDTFSTTESDWQGVDDEPTVGSKNLVTSGGVKTELNQLGQVITHLSGKILEDVTENVVSGTSNPYWEYQIPLSIGEVVEFSFDGTIILTGATPIRVYKDTITSANRIVSGKFGSYKYTAEVSSSKLIVEVYNDGISQAGNLHILIKKIGTIEQDYSQRLEDEKFERQTSDEALQGEIDILNAEIAAETITKADTSKYTVSNGYLEYTNNQLQITANANMRVIGIPIEAGRFISLSSKLISRNGFIAVLFTKEALPTTLDNKIGDYIYFSDTDALATISKEIPSECKYIYLGSRLSGGTYTFADDVEFTVVAPSITDRLTLLESGLQTEKSRAESSENALNASILDVKASVDEGLYGKYSTLEFGERKSGKGYGNTGELSDASGYYYDQIDISSFVGQKITLRFNAIGSSSGRCCVIMDNSTPAAALAYTTERDPNYYDVNGNAVYEMIVPDSAKYLRVSYSINVTDFKAEVYRYKYTEAVTIYLSPSGNDNNSGISAEMPMKTIGAALIKGATEILMADGYYLESNIALYKARHNSVRIASASAGAKPIIRCNDVKINDGSETLEDGTTKVYKKIFDANPFNDNVKWIWQEGVDDTSTLVSASERHPLQKNRTYRLENTRIIKCSSTSVSNAISEIESAEEYKFYWDSANLTLYFSRPHLTDTTHAIAWSNGYNLFNYNRNNNLNRPVSVEMYGIEVWYGGVNVCNMISPKLVECTSKYGCVSGGIVWNDSLGVQIIRCEVGGVQYSGNGDGYNAHTYNYSSDDYASYYSAEMVNCWSHDNYDDGFSDHQKGKCSISGCLFEYNTKGGVTPSYGSKCLCYNTISRRNYRGFYPCGVSEVTTEQTMLICYNCVAENNSIGGFVVVETGNVAILYNCKSISNAVGYICGTGALMELYDCKTLSDVTVKQADGTINVYNTSIVS